MAEEGYKGYLNHKQYTVTMKTKNLIIVTKSRGKGIASGDVTSGQSEGLSIVFVKEFTPLCLT